MNTQVTQIPTSLRSSSEFRTFSKRFERLTYLRQKCEPDHTVLAVELELVEMARNKLIALINNSCPEDKREKVSAEIENAIRAIAISNITDAEEDETMKEEMLETVRMSSIGLSKNCN